MGDVALTETYETSAVTSRTSTMRSKSDTEWDHKAIKTERWWLHCAGVLFMLGVVLICVFIAIKTIYERG